MNIKNAIKFYVWIITGLSCIVFIFAKLDLLLEFKKYFYLIPLSKINVLYKDILLALKVIEHSNFSKRWFKIVLVFSDTLYRVFKKERNTWYSKLEHDCIHSTNHVVFEWSIFHRPHLMQLISTFHWTHVIIVYHTYSYCFQHHKIFQAPGNSMCSSNRTSELLITISAKLIMVHLTTKQHIFI